MKMLAFVLALNLSMVAQASFENEKIYTGDTSKEVTLENVLDQVTPGTVVIVSEFHGFKSHHEHQVQVIEGLTARGLIVNVGMEFFAFNQQPILDEYLAGNIKEADFLTQIRWGGISYDNYRSQVLGSLKSGGSTFALNAPRTLSGKIARGGMGSLLPEDKKLLPPNFTLGNDLYFERFKAVMGGHVPAEKIERYFTAQSLWDETSAWQIIEEMQSRPDQVMVVIFGDFHNSYGGGLPDRLRARGYNKVVTVSQVDLTGADDADKLAIVGPSKKYGPRADFVWTAVRPDSTDIMVLPMAIESLEEIDQLGAVMGFRRLY